MDKVYDRIIYQNSPSTASALGATNLNKMDYAINVHDDRIIVLDTAKANQSTVNGVVQSITYNDATGVMTITKVNGTSTTIDTKLEKLAVNFSYNPTTQQLDITLDDGTVQHVDMSALVTQYEFLDTDTVSFSLQPDGKIKANIINGSITADKLHPNYLADIIVQANIATTQAGVATDAAEDALTYRDAALAAQAAAELARDQAVDISNVGIAGPNKLGLVSGNGNAVPDSLGAVWVDSSKDKATLTGSSVQFTTADDALIALSVKCKSTQNVTTQGKQLFDKAKATAVKYVQPVTGAISTSSYNNAASALIAVTAGQSVTISGHTFVQPNTPVGLAWYGPTGAYISGTSYQNATGNGTYTAPAGAAYVRYTCNNVDLNTSQLEAGTVATSYAAFVPTSPSLDYPATIISTGDGGSFVAGASGKNQASNVSYAATAQFFDSILCQFDGIKPDTTYTISLIIPTGEQYYPNENLFTSGLPLAVGDGTRKSFTLTTKSSVSFLNSAQYVTATNRWRIFKNYSGHSSSGTASQLQIELGTIATQYEAYKGNTITVNSGGGDLPDGTADTIGLETKKKTAKKAKTILDGNANVTGISTRYSGNCIGFNVNITDIEQIIDSPMRCTHLSPIAANTSITYESIMKPATNNVIVIGILKIRLTGYSDALTDAQKIALFKTYLTSNPVTIEYKLATPVTTDITVTPSNYLTSYKDITNVFTTDATQPTLTAIAKSELWARDYLQDVALAGKRTKGDTEINVKDYGAKGDGTTDDIVALNAAYAASGSGEVVYPSGNYYISSPLYITKTTRGMASDNNTVYIKGEVKIVMTKRIVVEQFTCDKLTVDGMWYAHFNMIKVNGIFYIGAYNTSWGTYWNDINNISCAGVNIDNTNGAINQNVFKNINSRWSDSSLSANLWIHGDNSHDCHSNTFIECDFTGTSTDKYAVLNELNQPNNLCNPYIEDLYNRKKAISGKWNIQGGVYEIDGTPIPNKESIMLGTVSSYAKTGIIGVGAKAGSYLPLNVYNLFPNGDIRIQAPNGGIVPHFVSYGSRTFSQVANSTAPNPYGRMARLSCLTGDTDQGLQIKYTPKANFDCCSVVIVYKGNFKTIWTTTAGVETYYNPQVTTDSDGWNIISFKAPSTVGVETTLFALNVTTALTANETLDIARIIITEGPIGVYGAVPTENKQFTDAIPTTGTWAKGDILYNSNVGSGTALGWVCTVAGTPGTWYPFGLVNGNKIAAQSYSTATDIATLKADFNSFVAKVIAAGLMS